MDSKEIGENRGKLMEIVEDRQNSRIRMETMKIRRKTKKIDEN